MRFRLVRVGTVLLTPAQAPGARPEQTRKDDGGMLSRFLSYLTPVEPAVAVLLHDRLKSQLSQCIPTPALPIGCPPALQLFPDLLLHFVEFCYASVNADAFALVQLCVRVSGANALAVT